MNKLPISNKTIRDTLLIVANLWVWYDILNPHYVTYRALTLVSLFTIFKLCTGEIISWKSIKEITFFVVVFDLTFRLLGSWSWIALAGIVIYIVYKVTTNPAMVKARNDLRDAIDNVEIRDK